MKKISAFALAFVIALSACGCSDSKEVPDDGDDVNVSTDKNNNLTDEESKNENEGEIEPEKPVSRFDEIFKKVNFVKPDVKDLVYVTCDDGNLVIIDYVGKEHNIEIPEEIDGVKVSGVSFDPFLISYDDSGKPINDIRNLKLPNSISSICFSGCPNLELVNIPDSVTGIGKEAFAGCTNLKSVKIPESVTAIGESAFYDCTSLKSAEILGNIDEIGNWAFAGCLSIESIDISKSNPNYCSVDGILFNKNQTELIAYPGGKKAKSYTVPDSVTKIADGAFLANPQLELLTISESVKEIGAGVFWHCEKLQSIKFNNNPKTLGFEQAIDRNKPCVLCDNIIGHPCDSLFIGCTSLKKIEIPNSVTEISKMAFSYSSITSIDIPKSVTKIGERAFYNCTNLRDVDIPDSVDTIANDAFLNCENIKVSYKGKTYDYTHIDDLYSTVND